MVCGVIRPRLLSRPRQENLGSKMPPWEEQPAAE